MPKNIFRFTYICIVKSQAKENYLKAIWKLYQHSNEAVSTNAIATEVNIRAASVTDMLKKLAKQKLIHYQPYKGVTLTKRGNAEAINTVRKHRLWELFLVDKLGFGWDEVHDIAEQLEHIQSETLTNRLDRFLGYPHRDPHGDPIPNQNGQITEPSSIPISNLKLGQHGILSGVGDHSPEFLQMLDRYKITLGQHLKIIESNAYDQSLVLLIDNHKKLQISHQVAVHLLVLKKRIRLNRLQEHSEKDIC